MKAIETYNYRQCPKCNHREGLPYFYGLFRRRYDKRKDRALYICPRCGFEGSRDEIVKTGTIDNTEELKRRARVESIFAQLDNAIAASKKAKVKLHYLELTINELALVMADTAYYFTSPWYKADMLYKGIPIRAYGSV